jgi:aspartate racemase
MPMYKTIGIIGGMGAGATVDLFGKIVALTDAKTDREHIPVLIDNNTRIPDRTQYLLGNGVSPREELIKSARRLTAFDSDGAGGTGCTGGAEILVLACNSSHYFIEDVRNAVRVPVLNMVEETANAAAAKGYKRVGILGTAGFVQCVDYAAFYDRHGIEIVLPTADEQKHVTALIYDGIKSANYDIDLAGFSALLNRMSKDGAQAFALSCTELPVAFERFGGFGISAPYIDSTLALAKKAVIQAGGKLKTGSQESRS